MAYHRQHPMHWILIPFFLIAATVAFVTSIFSCKTRSVNTNAIEESIGPESTGHPQQIPKLSFEECITGLKGDPADWMMTWYATESDKGLSKFLYCKDLLVAQFPDDNPSRECIDELITIPFLRKSGVVKGNSFGYPFSDSAYVAGNFDRIALEAVLPSIFDSADPDPSKRAKGEELFLGLFDGSHFNESLTEIKSRIDRVNSDPESTEKIFVANYRTEGTSDGSSSAGDTYRRLAFLSIKQKCTSFVNLVPNEAPGLKKVPLQFT